MNSRMMKNMLVMVLLSVSSAVLADHDRSKYEDYAKVKSVTPEYESVNVPRQVCREERVRERDERWENDRYRSDNSNDRSYAGVVLGGLTGALIGSQFGKGHGKSASVAVGAITGAVIGDKIDNQDENGRETQRVAHDHPRHRYSRVVQRCHTEDNWEKRVTGYRVVYEYAGRSYTTTMPNDPGRTIPVRVSVEPMSERVAERANNSPYWQ